MDESLNRDLYEQIVRGIADGRKKNEADVRTLIDEGPFLPEDALRAGLVDDVAYEDQVDDKLRARRAAPRDIDGDDYARVSLASLGLNRGPRIAVIYAAGTINGGKSGYDPVNGAVARLRHAHRLHPPGAARQLGARDRAAHRQPRRIGDRLRRDLARADDRAATSAPIGRSSRRCRISAASGGYYIAMPAQVIVAQPSTLTGSIGIFGGKFVTGGVYEKLGAHIESTSIGKHAEIELAGAPVQPRGAEEAAGAAAGVLRPVRREGRRVAAQHAGEDRRASRRAACGPDGRRSRTAWSTSSAASIARSRSPSSARRSRPTATSSSWSIPPRKSFYELVSEQFSGAGESMAQSARG